MSTELEKKSEIELVFKELNEKVVAVLHSEVNNIENSLVVANAIGFFREALTPTVMAPIMSLQGSKLGFRTDRDLVKNGQTGKYEKGPGYPLEVVKDCFIEMSLMGLLPTGNMWNIIGGNSYVTKEGGTYLLKKENGLKHVISFVEVNQSTDKKTASVKAKIKWTLNGETEEETVDFPVKSDAYTTFDALIGKADRKAKIWLYNKVSGLNISDGDIEDIPHTVVSSKSSAQEVSKQKERDRVIKHIAASKDIETLERCLPAIADDDEELVIMYDDRKRELKSKSK